MKNKNVRFKSRRNCKRRNKVNSTLKSNWNKIIMSLYNFLSEINNIFHVKGLIIFTFYVKLIDDRRKTEQENIKSLFF